MTEPSVVRAESCCRRGGLRREHILVARLVPGPSGHIGEPGPTQSEAEGDLSCYSRSVFTFNCSCETREDLATYRLSSSSH
ncbi:hypothetical protein ABVT39_009304 [Epinephelus coioides]